MKARLLYFEGSLQLLICNGNITMVSPMEAYEFLSNYDNQDYYTGPGTWDYEGVTMETFQGTTIAIVDDNDTLQIKHPKHFRAILQDNEPKLLTVAEYAARHGKQVSIVRRYCRENRMPGAVNKGNAWFIPEGTPYPSDERIKNK